MKYTFLSEDELSDLCIRAGKAGATQALSTNKLNPPETEGANSVPERGDISFASRITSLSKSTIYRLTSQKKIPHSKKGKLIFSKPDLLAWLAEGNQTTVAEEIIAADQKISVTGKQRNPLT